MKLFGFEIKRQSEEQEIPTFAEKIEDDGAVNLAYGGLYGTYVDLDGTVRTEAELVTKYRQMAGNPEIDQAIDEITNEAIVVEDGRETVTLILDEELENSLPEKYQSAIQEEFKRVLRLLEFDTKPYEIFRTWYRDGRLYYHKIVVPGQEAEGIQELRYLDPRKIRKARETYRKRSDRTTGQTVALTKTAKEYFLYSNKGFAAGNRALNDPSVEKAGTGDGVFRIA